MFFQKRKPRRLRRREEVHMWKKVLGASIVLCMCAGALYGVWYVTRIPRFLISAVKVVGVETMSERELTSRVETVLSGNYLGIIPRRFVYLYPRGAIVATLTSLPRIRTATLSRIDTTLTVSVTEQVPSALWCAEAENASTTPECFFINDEGVAYDKAPLLRGATFLRYTVAGQVPERGAELLNDAQRKYLVTFVNELQKKYGLGVSSITITTDTDAFLYLSSGARILISMNDAVASVYANLAAIFESKDFKQLVSGKFEYIDLRFGKKIFVQVHPPVATSTTSPSMATSSSR